MHPLNPYLANKPNFSQLAQDHPEFAPHVKTGIDGRAFIDFQDAAALRALTRCLLRADWRYDVDLRSDRLCPTIANRLDYLLTVLELEPYLRPKIACNPEEDSSRPTQLKVLDIGTGHIAIYPLLLHRLRPEARIVATEIDDVSFHNAMQTRAKNGIPPSKISLLRPTPEQPILFPICDDAASRPVSARPESQWDLVVCNPPFFASEAEMAEGQALKARGAPAAPTAAGNELITPGGEVSFVGQMITESMQLREQCRWYTSLIGKYASLQPLIDLLKRHQVDNYFIKILRQARTTRWVLGWSFTATRLPDAFTRPDELIPGTSFARLLPPPNSFSHTPSPPLRLADLARAVHEVLRSVQLVPDTDFGDDASAMGGTGAESAAMIYTIAPKQVTWSRAARRQAAKDLGVSDAETSRDGMTTAEPPLFRAELRIAPTSSAAATEGTSTGSSLITEVKGAAGAAQVELAWMEGRNRAAVEALWKFILTKAGLIRNR